MVITVEAITINTTSTGTVMTVGTDTTATTIVEEATAVAMVMDAIRVG